MTYKILVGVDRDNTINLDETAYFGKDDNWKEELRFCSGAIKGLQKLSENPDIAIAVITAQVGIAKGLLSEERVREIHIHMDDLLKEQGVEINSWQYCPYVSQNDSKRWEERNVKTINYDYVLSEEDERLELMKPKDGLLKKAAQELNIDYNSIQKYVIGDRTTDAICGLNSGGIGILVNNPEIKRGDGFFDQIDTIISMQAQPEYRHRLYVVTNLIEAASVICK